MRLVIGPIFSEFECEERYVKDLVREVSRFRKKGYQFTEAFKEKRWDGWVNLSRELTGEREGLRFPTGFVPHLIASLTEEGVDFEIENQRVRPKPSVKPTRGDLEGVVLRDYQRQMVSALMADELRGESHFVLNDEVSEFLYSGIGRESPYRLPGIGIWWSATGCHARDAEIMMFSGEIRKVQDVLCGDLLMGWDLTCREVLSLIVGHGRMYRVSPSNGDPFVVNEDHLLTLVHSVTGDVIDMSVCDWLSWKDEEKDFFNLFRVSVEKCKAEEKNKDGHYQSFAKEAGDRIPVKTYQQAGFISMVSFEVDFYGESEFYGFVLDGDGRYLMADSLVTHNSGKTECSASLIGSLGVRSLFLVYGKSLVNQTYNRFCVRFGRWLLDNDIKVGLISEGFVNFQFITVASSSTVSSILRGPKLIQGRLFHVLDLLSGKRSKEDKAASKVLLKSTKLKKKVKGKIKRTLAKVAQMREEGVSEESLSKIVSPEMLLAGSEDEDSVDLSLFREWISNFRMAAGRDYFSRLEDLLLKLEAFPFFNSLLEYYRLWIRYLQKYPERALEVRDKRESMLEYLGKVELLILDEAHGGASETIVEIMEKCPAYYKCGMSGSPLDRSDDANLKIIGYFGDVIARVTNSQMRKANVIPPASVIVSKIGGSIDLPKGVPFYEIENQGIVHYMPRNYKVIRHIQEAYNNGLKIFVLVRVREHGELLSRMLWCEPDNDGDHTFIPHEILHNEPIEHEHVDGRDSQEVREAVVSKFRAGIIRVVIATGIFKTGLDVPEIEMVIRADGGEGKISVKQGAGRTLRGTKPVIIRDYADGHHRVLAKHSLKRLRTYQAEECFDIKFERD